jgi:predicted secreted Zn-dependent protease
MTIRRINAGQGALRHSVLRRRRALVCAALALVCAALMLAALPARALDWTATEETVHYAIDGASGMALYQSIGANGPVVSLKRAIARTDNELLWGRDYVPQGTACRLAEIRPFLTITYTLPRPRGALDGAVAAKWSAFIAGITTHEEVHGALMRSMVDDIIAQTDGLVVADDPGCRKIRAEVERRVIAAHARYKAQNRAFEASEMAPGGNIRGLIMGLVR